MKGGPLYGLPQTGQVFSAPRRDLRVPPPGFWGLIWGKPESPFPQTTRFGGGNSPEGLWDKFLGTVDVLLNTGFVRDDRYGTISGELPMGLCTRRFYRHSHRACQPLLSIKPLLSYFERQIKYIPKTGLIMTWGGLRGGISIALALTLPQEMYRDIFLVFTYMIVVFSILVQGLSLEKLVKKFQV